MDDVEQMWIIEPEHPIVDGLLAVVTSDPEEMYGEPFDAPPPDQLTRPAFRRHGRPWRRSLRSAVSDRFDETDAPIVVVRQSRDAQRA